MTIQCYVHSIVKRAEIVALVDSGATENFMNLTYARWLQLPIKTLKTRDHSSMWITPETKVAYCNSTRIYKSVQARKTCGYDSSYQT